jgi:hypothetical protein
MDELITSNPALDPQDAWPRPERKFRWGRLRDWFLRQWADIRPGPEARRGAVWGTLAAAAACVVIGGLYLHSGFGHLFDFAFCIVFAALFIPLVGLLIAFLLTIARALPRFAAGFIFGSCVILMVLWGPPEVAVPMAVLLGLTEGILGATIATFFWSNLRQAALSKKIVVASLFILALIGNVYFVWLFAHEGSMEKLISWKPPASSMPA